MKRAARTLLTAILTMISITFAGVAFAGAATDVVKTKQTVLFDLLKGSAPDNAKKIAGVFDEMLDYATIAEGSLGTEWAARSDAEKTQFSDLLKQLVRKAYERNLRKTLDFDIAYTGEDADGGTFLVKTKATSRADSRDEPIEIDYRMKQKDSTWKVQDIITEEVSLVSSYRSQFTKIIKKDGFPALIQKMKDKLAKGDI